MYGFLLRPRWLAFHLVVAGAIVLMINLGLWQLNRLDERQAFNQTVIERTEQTPVPISEFLAGEYDPETDEWTPVSLSGTYLPGQIVQFNVSQGGRAGENILTPLALTPDAGVEGDVLVIVNRGFIPLGPGNAPPPPSTEVEIVGVVRASQERGRGGLTDAEVEQLNEVRRINLEVIGEQFDGGVAPFYVQLFSSEPPVAIGDPEPVQRPELSNGPHLSYAIQWFIFALCVAIGWVLAVRRSVRNRQPATVATSEPSQGSGGEQQHGGGSSHEAESADGAEEPIDSPVTP